MKANMQTNKINDILYVHDPMGTCCNLNEGMEDEYWSVADMIAQLYLDTQALSLDTIRDSLTECFGIDEELIDYDLMVNVFNEVELIIGEL